MYDKLTPRQNEIFSWLRSQVFTFNNPSLFEIATHFGMANPSSAQKSLIALEKKKYIARQTGKSRSFKILVID